jgi:hypothetical protein
VATSVFLVGALASGCGSSHPKSEAGPGVSSVTRAAVTPTTTATTATNGTLSPTTTTTIDPGLLPQTHILPSATDPAFAARVQGLWQAVVSGDPAPAMTFFFPMTAYRQVKAEVNPDGDWQYRLVAQYRVDVARLHRLLGLDAAAAEFVGIDVPTSESVWVRPGEEYNKGSYYRVYGTRVRYDLGGVSGSFAVYSMISWRGEWYVVHLGPIPGLAPAHA